MASFHLEIVTPDKRVYSSDVESLVVMAHDGYLGVRTGHAPMLARLGIGQIRITEPGGTEVRMACSGGLMEVEPRRTVILADAVERPEEIDVARAEAALERARARLQDRSSIDVARAEAALQRAMNRLKVAAEGRPGGA
ncbi:MAG: F0F1 ATP synthase subunit epsilon [Armatimonadota bacterium]